MYQGKIETFKGQIVNKINYYAAKEGKKSFAKFDFYTDKKGQDKYIRVLAFADLADSIAEYGTDDKFILGVQKGKVEGEWILQTFRLENEAVTVQQKTSLSAAEIEKVNNALEKEGMALVSIQIHDRSVWVKKKISETLTVGGKRFDKLEYILDVLGGEYVSKRLKEKLGKDLKFSKEYSSAYRQLKTELLKEALEMGAT